jgi:hypothetical protein
MGFFVAASELDLTKEDPLRRRDAETKGSTGGKVREKRISHGAREVTQSKEK